MAGATKTYLDLIQECDGFPFPDQKNYARITSQLYQFRLKKVWRGDDDESDRGSANPDSYVTVGWMLASVVDQVPWTDKFRVDHGAQTVSIPWPTEGPGSALEHGSFESQAILEQLQLARKLDRVPILRKWRNESYRILGLSDGREVRMERAGSAVFGINTVGVHVLGFSRIEGLKESEDNLRLWIPRRSPTKQTYPNMLDNTIGGGMTAEEDAVGCLVREAYEEASLPPDYVKAHARAAGAISYFLVRDERAGGPEEVGLLQPSTQILYDLELKAGVVPKPSDGEVAEFLLWTPAQTIAGLKEGRFKPNSSLAWIDFLIRHGYVTAQNEPDYLELVSRLHRRLHF
ncbi:hypothetical protein DL771_006951 [Monosporascus sp. 5C6A]|nr:hypothetical protein DL771_006951 [Monosporascus sp. 5C6A]